MAAKFKKETTSITTVQSLGLIFKPPCFSLVTTFNVESVWDIKHESEPIFYDLKTSMVEVCCLQQHIKRLAEKQR
jgi:hypothetical protein